MAGLAKEAETLSTVLCNFKNSGVALIGKNIDIIKSLLKGHRQDWDQCLFTKII